LTTPIEPKTKWDKLNSIRHDSAKDERDYTLRAVLNRAKKG